VWHRIKFNPFTASYSPISEAMAKAEIGADAGDLYAPAENKRYEQQTREAMARQGITIPKDANWDHDDEERRVPDTEENLKRSRRPKPASDTPAEKPPSDHPRLVPMPAERRLKPGQSVLTFIAPKPSGERDGDPGRGGDPGGR
jgi:hypothetical protein